MTQFIEDYLPPIQSAGLNTAKVVTLTGGTTTAAASLITLSATSTSTSGGYPTPGVAFGSGNIGIYSGAGAPTIGAGQPGSLYLNVVQNSGSTRLYISSGSSWIPIVTAS